MGISSFWLVEQRMQHFHFFARRRSILRLRPGYLLLFTQVSMFLRMESYVALKEPIESIYWAPAAIGFALPILISPV